MRRVMPLFNEILLDRFEQKDESTITILSQYLAKIITQTSKDDPTALSLSLQSIISPAISKEIADNRDSMVDTLYPIIGGMISKYVTQSIKEMMENINHKIEDGLSINRYKRKLKSKITGVSETELLLEENSNATLYALFIIEKESGLLIAEAQRKEHAIEDAHMVASMASAIKDFINDWIATHASQSEVQILSYGNATLYIEGAGSVYLIAFLDSEPDYEQRREINTFFASIVKEYTNFFHTFDGDDSAKEIKHISTLLHKHLEENHQNEPQKKSKINPAKYMVWVLALLTITYFGYLVNNLYYKYAIEKMIHKKTAQKITVTYTYDNITLNGYVDSIETVERVERLISRVHIKPIYNRLSIPVKQVALLLNEKADAQMLLEDKLKIQQRDIREKILKSNEDFVDKITLLEEKIQNTQQELISMIDEKTGTLEKLKNDKLAINALINIRQEIEKKLQETFIDNIFYHPDTASLDFRTLHLFEASKDNLTKEQVVLIGETFEKYMRVLVDYKPYIRGITIEGHADSSGMEEENLALSKKRALSIKYYLLRLPILRQYHMKDHIQSVGYGSQKKILIDGIEDKNASRRVEIRFELKKSAILENIKKIVHD